MSEHTGSDAAAQSDESHDSRVDKDRIDFLGLLVLLATRKKLIVAITFGAALVSVVVSLLLPKTYTGVTRFLPPQQTQSILAGSLLSQFGGLASVAAGALGIRNAADMFTGMLKSETIATALVTRFELQNEYRTKTMFDAVETLHKRTTIAAGKDGIIVVAVEDREPKRSADLANAYIEEVQKLTAVLGVSEAAQRREFLEKQLKTARDELTNAEVALKETQQETGVIKLDDQGKAIIENMARLRGMLTAKEIQLSGMRMSSTDQNPDYRRGVEETATLRSQIARLEKDGGIAEKGDIFVPTGRVPESGLKYLRKVRDVKYYETIFDLLARQYEIAKIDEARDSFRLQVIDPAVTPEKRSSPQRAVIVIVSTFLGFMAAVMIAYVLDALERARRDPERSSRIDAIKNHLRTW